MKRSAAFILCVFIAISYVYSSAKACGSDLGGIPSYYSLLDYNLTSPSAYATAMGGMANPAVYRMLPGSEFHYFWSDEKAQLESIDRWGLFMGTPGLGFSALKNRVGEPHEGGGRVTDYRLSLAMGNKSTSFGLAYGWSGGDKDRFERTNVVQVGAVQRFGRYVSFGIAGTFSTEKDARVGLADLAVRPLGNRLITIFGDGEMGKKTRFNDARWSAGAMFEVLPGVRFIGRYFDDESFALAFGFSFGKLSGTVSPRYDSNSDLAQTLYGVRLGYDEKNVFDEYVLKNRAYLAMNLKGYVKYRKYRFFEPKTPSFYEVISSLEDAKHDPRVKGVALNLSGAQISREKAWEIREKLQELQKEGKHVVIYIDNAEMTLYHLASVADHIVMDPDGFIALPGYAFRRTYLKNTLEKVGLGFEEWRFFKYKSAMEGFSRDKMSDADREQIDAYSEDLYKAVRTNISHSRELTQEDYERLVSDVPFLSAKMALEEKLIDGIGRWVDVTKEIEKLEGSKKRYMGSNDLARREFPSMLWGENPRIAIVYGLGECAMDSGINARKLEKVFQALEKDRRVKGVVFRVDSPGGDGMASDVVAEALRKCSLKKPVIVTQGDVAGSGGYWISMYGDKILAGPMTITGSIGVIGGWLWDIGLSEKLGLTYDIVKQGEHSDLGFGVRFPFLGVQIPGRNLTEKEYAIMENHIKTFYKEFLGKVAKGRDMKEEAVHEVGQGRIWSGVDGVDNGLIDRIGGLDMAIEMAWEAAGLEPDEEVDIIELPKMGLFNIGAFKGGSPFAFSFAFDLGGIGKTLSYSPLPPEDEMWYERYEEAYLKAIVLSKGRPLHMVPPEYLPKEVSNIWMKE